MPECADATTLPPEVEVVSGDPERCALADMLATGATYRQIDYWTVHGYIGAATERSPGHGFHRRYTWADRDAVRLILAFVTLGLTVPAAADLAWATLDDDRPNTVTTDGLTLTWEVTA